MMWIIFIFFYIVIATVVAIGWAKSDDETVFESEHPGYFLAGVVWPIMIPIIIGTKIAKKIFEDKI